jgi:hypothetical protein
VPKDRKCYTSNFKRVPQGRKRSAAKTDRIRLSFSHVSPIAGVQRVQTLWPSLGREGLGGFEKHLGVGRLYLESDLSA